jgi:hypothetical protein
VEYLPPVCGKGFVRPITWQRGGYILSCQFAHPQSGQSRRIGKGLIEYPSDPVHGAEIIGIHHPVPVVDAEHLRHLLRVTSLVQRRDIEADGTGFYLSVVR